MKTNILLITLVFLFSGCSKKLQKSETFEMPEFKIIAKEKYGASVQYLFNESQTHVICYKQSKDKIRNQFNMLQYFVYDIKKCSILLEADLSAGKIRWLDDKNIEIQIIPGIVQAKDPEPKQTKIININNLN
jgi:hypothetical protein